MTPSDAPRKIRVLHFVVGVFRGGSAEVAIQLVKSAQTSAHIEPLLVLRQRRQDPRMGAELEAAKLPFRAIRRRSRLATIWALVHICREFQPDILVAHGFSEHLWGRYAGLIAGVPHLIHVEHNTREPYSLWQRMQTRWLAQRSARMIGVSEAVRDVLLEMGMPENRTIAIPNGIDLTTFANANAHPLTAREPGIIMAARLCRQKDHATLIRALALLRERGLTPSLWLAGSGRESKQKPLQHLTDELGLNGQVHFLGLRLDVPELMLNQRICVLISHWEGLPLTLIEGMAAGCAVIGSNVIGTREVITDGVDGLLVPPADPQALADALERLLRDGTLAARLGAAARNKALTEYGRETMNARYERLCLELAK